MKRIFLLFTFVFLAFKFSADENAFIKGFDASMVSQIEEKGGVYKNSSGNEEDIFKILKDNGINWIRLRLWNSPSSSIPGNNTIERTLQIAKRIKAQNLKFLLDIHYSDTWADPSNQKRPSAWDADKTIDSLAEHVFEYTTFVLKSLADYEPDMIQIGNEINPGMLVTLSNAESIEEFANPTCSSWKNAESEKNLGIVLDSASSAIRNYSDKIKIMIHLSSQENDDLTWWFDRLKNNSRFDFDVIGLSYYPFYSHGNLSSLKSNIKTLSEKYGKKVLVAETSFAWTDDYNDETSNLFGNEQKSKAYENFLQDLGDLKTEKVALKMNGKTYRKNGISSTVKNQSKVLEKIIAATKNSSGIGIFYWGGDWICANGIENNWENQALFDFEGKALPTLEVFKF